MMASFIIWVGIFAFLSCLDVVTTYVGMRDLSPREMEDRELNPFMAKIISKRVLAWGTKITMVVILSAILLVFLRDCAVVLLQFISIATAIVVVNNVYATWAVRRQRLSPGQFFIRKLHIPKPVAYFILVGCVLFLTVGFMKLANLDIPC